ncbi:MAG: hypothetical protein C0618_04965 [Desulfuromonas sp.]|nr:MAG: hypothetical protein C0618_04965 [Desulfuromonas sp.]
MGRLLWLLPCLLLLIVGCDRRSPQDLVEEGLQFSAQGNHRGAIVLFKNALEADPSLADAPLYLGRAYLARNKLEHAERQFLHVLENDPDNADAVLDLARVYLKMNRPDQVASGIYRRFGDHPRSADALEMLGHAAGMQGDLDRAERFFLDAEKIDPRHLQVKLGLARVALDRHQDDRARQILKAVLSLDTNNQFAWYYLAELETTAQHFDAALTAYQRLIELDSTDVVALSRAGLLSLSAGRPDQTLKMADAIDALPTDFAEAPRLRGLVAYVSGDFRAAKTHFLNALRLQPHLNSHFFLGLSYYALEQYESALNQFQAALDLSPDFIKGRQLTAMTLIKQGRYGDAVRQCRQALSIDDQNVLSQRLLASAYIGAGEVDRGVSVLEGLIISHPQQVGAYIHKGLAELSRGDEDAGEKTLQSALEIAPQSLSLRSLLAEFYLRKNNYPRAEQALLHDEDNAESSPQRMMRLAQLYEQQGEDARAEEVYLSLTQRFPAYIPALLARAISAHRRGKLEAAEGLYRQVLARNPDTAPALNNLAYLLSAQPSRIVEALQLAEKAHRLDNTDPYVQDTLGYILVLNDRSGAALKPLRGAYSQIPENVAVNLHLASAYINTDQAEQARPHLDLVIRQGGRAEQEQAQVLLRSLKAAVAE